MRTTISWTLGTALFVGLLGMAPAVRAGSKDEEKKADASSGSSWFGHWFGWGDKKDTANAPDKKNQKSGKHRIDKTEEVDPVEKEQARELDKYLRRLGLCQRLHEIAEDTDDKEMLRKVEQLDKRIWAIWSRKSSGAKDASVELEEADVDQQLGSRAASKGLRTKELPDRAGMWRSSKHAAVKEVDK